MNKYSIHAGPTIPESLINTVRNIAEINESEYDYIAYFKGKKYELKAKSLWDAKQKAVNHFSPPKKDLGQLAVELVNKEGPARIQFEDINESIDIQSLINRLRAEWVNVDKMSTETAAKVGVMLDKLPTKVLRAVSKADIKFVSSLALNRVSRRKNVTEETEIIEEGRPLYQIARDIRRDWKNVNYAAAPYLSALGSLDSIKDNYEADSGKSIVLYFLANAGTWKGPKAKEIKAELKAMLKEDTESLNEISKEKLKNYLIRSRAESPALYRQHTKNASQTLAGDDYDPNAEERLRKTANKIWNRNVGFHKALDRVSEEKSVHDIEPLDELSQQTLINYLRKSRKSEYDQLPKQSNGLPINTLRAERNLPPVKHRKYINRRRGIDSASSKLPLGVGLSVFADG